MEKSEYPFRIPEAKDPPKVETQAVRGIPVSLSTIFSAFKRIVSVPKL